MSKRAKLVSLITSFCLMLTLLVVGVFAARTATVPMGGQINFTATGINAKITYIGTTGGTLTETLPTLEYSTHDSSKNPNETTLGKWGDMNLTFADGSTELYVELTVENKDSKPLYVTITTPTVPEGMTITPVTDLTAKTLTKEVARESTVTYYVVFTVTNDLYDIENARFDVNVALDVEKPGVKLEQQMKTDSPTEVDYHYVTMGIYTNSEGKEEAVRWRCVGFVADDGTYTRSTDPEKGQQAIFVQETYLDNKQPFLDRTKYRSHDWDDSFQTREGLTDVFASDYSTSDIRNYLTGTDETSLKVTLKISDDDIVYSSITGRTLEDLYLDAGEGYSGGALDYPTNPNVPSKDTVDKLWLLSVGEIYTLCGGTKVNGKVSTWTQEVKDNAKWVDYYWLRTSLDTFYCMFIWDEGTIQTCDVGDLYLPRAAFLLNI